MVRKLFFLIFIFAYIDSYAWEEDPRIEDHNKLTSLLIKIGDKQAMEGEEDDEEEISD